MNNYTKMQKTFYENETETMKVENHEVHNSNPDYWNILLGPIKDIDLSKKTALDFGCGCGRNVLNLRSKFNFKSVHGCDISSNNIKYCENYLINNGFTDCEFFTVDGVSLDALKSNSYDFLMSTIVLQHIPVYDIRKSILTDFYRVMKSKGILSFQMGFGTGRTAPTADYFDNVYEATGTNSLYDCRVTDPQQVISDLTEIGFKNIKTEIRESFSDNHKQWIFIQCTK